MQRTLTLVCMVTLLLFVQSHARAQEQEPFKKNLIGGSLAFNNTNGSGTWYDSEKYKSTKSLVTVTYAHYIKKNVALGINLSYLYAHENNPTTNDPYTSNTNSFYFAPFIRYDVPLWQSRFTIFNDLGISGNYSRSIKHFDTYTESSKFWGLGAFYSPGLMFRLKSNISLQASFGPLVSYSYSSSDDAYGVNTHSLNFAGQHILDNLQFGINFLF
ncbi:Outer membrane protein beta-barrel domain-containing protein [Chitinophaga rupis]|uniref:Outer membrane protein beta-barrel domain-containing protein n=1 Tax=Chitinophaga rupis TaxID=573321 RepID=A0A1H8A9L4_9BACT|nr:outer membrane beta-barrel protein [Chitinophaga rupis]SEM67475.1 Outer membrane protein beta-barrel domain-containing protein [Chitinophaga rupis]